MEPETGGGDAAARPPWSGPGGRGRPIRPAASVRHCEWQSGHTSDVMTAPIGWRQQPSCPLPCQPGLGLELSVFKPEGVATSSALGGRVRGPRPDRRIPSGGPMTPKLLNKVLARENTPGHFQGSSREPYLRVPCCICPHAVASRPAEPWRYSARGRRIA